MRSTHRSGRLGRIIPNPDPPSGSNHRSGLPTKYGPPHLSSFHAGRAAVSPCPSGFRPYAREVRKQVCGTTLAFAEAFRSRIDFDLPQQHHPPRSRSSPRRLDHLCRHRPILPRIRRQKALRRNRCHEIPCSMLNCATAWGHRPEAAGNPCKRIVRYRRPPRGRLLGADNLAKPDAVLRQRKAENNLTKNDLS